MSAGGLALRGVFGIPQTPFLPDGTVDLESLARGVQDRLDAGVSALLTTVVASETSRLTPQERRTVLDTALRVNDGKVPVFAGTMGHSPQESLEFGAYAISRGCAGLLVQPPAGIGADLPALTSYLRAILASKADLVILQDLDWHGAGMPVETILRLVDLVPQIRSIKVETSPAGPKYSALRQATAGAIHVCGGWAATQLVEALDRGIDAIAAGGNHWTFARLFKLYDAGDRQGVRDLFARLLPSLAFMHQHIDISNWLLKELAVRQGIYATSGLRSPDIPVDAYHRRVAGELVDDLLVLEQEMRAYRPVPAGHGSELG